MTTLTVPNRRRSLFAAFRGGVDDHQTATEVPGATAIERETEIDGAPLAGSLEPAGEADDIAASVSIADNPRTGNSRPAKRARGGVFSGTRAQIRLAPSKASTHPTSGRRGDLFVDSEGRLWFCRSGGKAATWKQVKLI